MGCSPNMCNANICSMCGQKDGISTLAPIFRWGGRALGSQGTLPQWHSSPVTEVGLGSNYILSSLSPSLASTYQNYSTERELSIHISGRRLQTEEVQRSKFQSMGFAPSQTSANIFFTSNALWSISLNVCVNLARALDGYRKAVWWSCRMLQDARVCLLFRFPASFASCRTEG